MTVILHTPTGSSFAIERTLVVGRLPECDVVIADALVSGRHFEIGPAPGGAQLVDLQSSNGTFVNGERIAGPRVLTGGEEIAIGSQRLTVERVVETKPADLSLTVRVGPDVGATAEVSGDAPLLIGRAADAAIALTDPLVSGRHCQVALVRPPAGPCPHCQTQALAGDAHCVGCGRQRIAAEVQDLGSANGTLVDGTPVPANGRADLLEGGEIQVGDTVIVFGSPSDPVQSGPAPTVIRSIPKDLAAGAPVAAQPASGGGRRIPAVAWIAGAVVIVAIAVVAIVVAGRGGGSGNDPAWVAENRGSTVMQIFACDGSDCDGTQASGTGSVIDLGEGLVLTNFHVMANDDASRPLPNLLVGVSRTGEEIKEAEVVGYSACDDLALLRITEDVSAFNLEEVEFAAADSIKVGEQAVVLGYPGTVASTSDGDQQLQLTVGAISAVGVSVENYVDLIQTDASINPGNSGGPVFDLDGRQIGVASLGETETQGIGYAISIGQVEKVLPDLKAGTKQAGLGSCPAA